MFSEILKISPQLDNGDLGKMDSALTKRFGAISKKFGKGLLAALTGGGIAGIALGFIDKLLNPLKEVQEAIDKTLHNADDLQTYAEKFNTTSGKLFKLQQAGVATGLAPEMLYMMIEKFQSSVAEAKADPTKQTSVRQFVGMQDTAEAFYKFVQGMQKIPKDQKPLVENEVFGERLVLKVTDFMQSDFAALFGRLHALGSEDYTPKINNLGKLNDLKDEFTAKRNLSDIFVKGGLINGGMIGAQDREMRQEQERENNRIANYQSLNDLRMSTDKILGVIEKDGLGLLRDIIPAVKTIADFAAKLPTYRGIRALLPGGKGKGD
jgi:hypothetical protein